VQNEEKIRRILLEIIRIGLLRARACGWDGDADRCALEAVHIHNLPGILLSPKLELLLYYYDTERASFSRKAREVNQFDEAWKSLETLLNENRPSNPARNA
jgi:hypothetical protein